jgi:hypothetical protein
MLIQALFDARDLLLGHKRDAGEWERERLVLQVLPRAAHDGADGVQGLRVYEVLSSL